jgi:hypothetical protein
VLSALSGRDTNHSDKNRLVACASPAAAAAPEVAEQAPVAPRKAFKSEADAAVTSLPLSWMRRRRPSSNE